MPNSFFFSCLAFGLILACSWLFLFLFSISSGWLNPSKRLYSPLLTRPVYVLYAPKVARPLCVTGLHSGKSTQPEPHRHSVPTTMGLGRGKPSAASSRRGMLHASEPGHIQKYRHRNYPNKLLFLLLLPCADPSAKSCRATYGVTLVYFETPNPQQNTRHLVPHPPSPGTHTLALFLTHPDHSDTNDAVVFYLRLRRYHA
jgi:hypothetical protein